MTRPVCLLVAGDPEQTTGGYLYDARIAAAVRHAGRPIECVGLAGCFPEADAAAVSATADALARIPDGDCVVIDGLVLGGLPETVARHARRLRIVALVHHPLADESGLNAEQAERLRHSERQALRCVAHVVVTSAFTGRRLSEIYGVAPRRLDIIEPGVEPGLDPPTPRPRRPNAPPRLLCVASVIPRKGHAVLVDALARISDLDWYCECIGDACRDRDCAAGVRAAIARRGLTGRVELAGGRSPQALAAAYDEADLFVLPSYYEGYGMVVAEALAHALPVVTTTGGALADTLPAEAGVAVAPGDDSALAGALRRLLLDPDARRRLGAGAARAAALLPSWQDAGQRFAAVLDNVCPR